MANIPHGKIIDSSSYKPISGAQIMIYDANGKLHSTLTANANGEFSTSFPKGEYGLTMRADGFVLDVESAITMPKTADVIYDGGTFEVASDGDLVDMIVPVRKVSALKNSNAGMLRSLWGTLQYAMSKRRQGDETSYGIVRDVSTQKPLDLAVIRLFDSNTGQLLETKISDIYGKFSLLPSPGVYKVTFSREGYEDAVKEHVEVTTAGKSTLHDPVDLKAKPVV